MYCSNLGVKALFKAIEDYEEKRQDSSNLDA
jgi:NifU-like protein involved in Fe-S cluster formation